MTSLLDSKIRAPPLFLYPPTHVQLNKAENERMLHRRDRASMLTSSCCECSRVSAYLSSTLCILSHDRAFASASIFYQQHYFGRRGVGRHWTDWRHRRYHHWPDLDRVLHHALQTLQGASGQ